MTHKQLEYFLKTAETLNMTKAAKELYISQPSLSEQIKKLEEYLGVDLFYRENKSLKLTIAGKVLIGETYELFAKEKELVDAVRTAGIISRRHLTIRYISGIFLDKISDLAQRFRQLHPDIMLTLSDMNWNDMNDVFTDGDYDAAFYLRLGEYDIPNSGHIDLASSKSGILLSDKHPLAQLKEIHFEDIRNETFCLDILPRKSKLKFQSLYQTFEAHNAKLPNILPATNLENIMVNIRSGMAITIISPDFIAPIQKGMQCIPFSEGSNTYFSLYWSTNSSNPAIPLFVDFIQKNFFTKDLPS